MKKRRLFTGLCAILLAACAPARTQSTPLEAASPTQTIIQSTETENSTDVLNSATPPPTVQAVATSRGPNLEATDPNTVSMAVGGLQFVEFFEFW
jgi:hypothetical protein